MTTTDPREARTRAALDPVPSVPSVPSRPGRAAHFAAIAHGAGPGCRIRLLGELDLATAPTLRTVLDQVRNAGRRHVTLDLSEMTFLAAAGLNVFTEADQQFRAAHGSLTLAHPCERVRHLLRVSGVDTTVEVFPHTTTRPVEDLTPGLHLVPPPDVASVDY